MRRLGKKPRLGDNSIEAFSNCDCTCDCPCYCDCMASPTFNYSSLYRDNLITIGSTPGYQVRQKDLVTTL